MHNKRNILAVVFAALALLGCEDYQAEAQNRIYCEAVDLWVDSDGEYGHPDYKEIYNAQCSVPSDSRSK